MEDSSFMQKRNKILALVGTIAAFSVTALIAHDTTTTNSGFRTSTNAPGSQYTTNDIDMKKLSEAFGHFIGRNLKSPGVSFDLEGIIKGMRAGAAGQSSPMNDQEYEAAMLKVQELAFSKLSEDNLKTAESFLAKNAQNSNVKSLIPGKLQYIILSEGTGSAVPEHGSPSIKYTAKYLDGTVFDSSEAAGGPITVPIDQTIPGFSKGIVGMKEGEKRRLFVHPDLAYGKTGQLPPNSALIFEVEVVKAIGDTKKLSQAIKNDKDNDDNDDDDDDDDDNGQAYKAGKNFNSNKIKR